MASHSAAGSAAETRWRDVLSGTPDLVSTGATGYRTDPELVRGCLAGSPGAFDLLVHLHQRAVYRLCFRFMGNHEDAADLSQEVFLRAHRGLASFRSKSSLSTWLYRIGVNLCLNRVSLKRPPIRWTRIVPRTSGASTRSSASTRVRAPSDCDGVSRACQRDNARW